MALSRFLYSSNVPWKGTTWQQKSRGKEDSSV
jgi:hypothetical protein